ncbi:M16 family metallopeptidase [Actinoplanes subglobosus]|uniref:M16 family metallopeptidase n=1 Tax=Actinoplanes subglobosus TaxID=1547892 RepID=A0ABV8J5K7_9ACTN
MIERFEIDGVPGLFTRTDGPTRAGLAFRVGFADEPLSRHGITHLIEHLALFPLGVADYHYNGATGNEITYFHTQGGDADVVAFLHGVCRSLHDLPLHRLATEKEILRTERRGRGLSADDLLDVNRHGARDFGTHGYGELGLPAVTPDGLRRWTDWFFTRGNAAWWVAGPAMPPGLRLSLPEGVRRPPPRASSVLPTRPAFITGPAGMLAWNAGVRRHAASAVFAVVLQRAMFRSLRQESGISYTVQADYTTRGDGSAIVSASADALPEKSGAVLGGFVDVLAALRYAGVDPAEVGTVIAQECDRLAEAARRGALLPDQVLDLLSGRPVLDLPDMIAELRAVTPAQVRAIAAEAWADGLLMAPQGVRVKWAGFTKAPSTSTFAVTGAAHPAIGDPEIRLVVGQQGVSLVAGEDDQLTVTFDRCAALLAYPDGGRRLIGHDGISVPVEPTVLENAAQAVPYIDSRVHPDLRVDLPPRDPGEIPQPPSPEDDDDDECCDDDCCDSDCCDGDCCSSDDCAGECCETCCDDDCCPSDCRDGECCADDGCPGRCCTSLRGRIRRMRNR